MERLDKLLTMQGLGSRSDVKDIIRQGRVIINGRPCFDPGQKTDPEKDIVQVDGQAVNMAVLRYGMLNKPSGILTAANDRKAKTVMDLLNPKYKAMGLMPVGRLDKDARGLLFFTTDGPLAHFLLSPRRHVAKEYLVTVNGPLGDEDVLAFENGLVLSDFTAQPAKLDILETGPQESKAMVTLKEGKFHQVKRMFLNRGLTVTDLQRISFGSLRLDESLPEGGFRELSEMEIAALRSEAYGEDQSHA
jgi:16S rRNA pseudouridine516 synthase